ncbi:MAG: polysaccharide biosynthesis protein [Paludibacteraceae bacterium]|nr:polysaccharide biosynthesis protein [Paludibacteraceae bacterium]
MAQNQYNSINDTDMFSHFSSMKYMPHWAVLLMDLFLCLVAFVVSLLIGHGLFRYEPTSALPPYWAQALIMLLLQTLSFWIFHTYSGILRYSTFIDTLKVLFSSLLTGVFALFANFIGKQLGQALFLNTVCIIYVFVAFMFLFSLRVGVKTIFETVQQNASTTKKVLIYGTKQAGIAIAKMLRSSGDSLYRPVGFIEDDNDRRTYNLLGLKVYRLDDSLIERMQRIGVRNVIVSPLKMKELKPSRDLAFFLNNNIHVLTTPYFTEWDSKDDQLQSNKIGRIDSIQIEDLLERPVINLDTENVSTTIRRKIVLVSGAAGSIGSELVRQILPFKPKAVILLEQAESPLHDLTLDLKQQYPDQRIIPCIGDVRDRERVEEVISDMRPDVVFHAAAYKHVPLMEDHPNEAIHANVLGTKNMADMAVKYKVDRFVMISTDKAVNPTNIMGASKRIAEMYVQSLYNKLAKDNDRCTKFITTRFGNVLGSNGSVIPYFKKQIAQGGPVTVTHPEIIRYFMTIPEACCLVLEAATLGKGGEIFVFDMGQPVRILDLAKNMIRLAGYTPGKDMQITFTGLRPGEKLYEELLNQKETTLPTQNDKIMVAKVREVEFDEVSSMVDELIEISKADKPFQTVAQMKKIVPEFKSKNSVYEKLDK